MGVEDMHLALWGLLGIGWLRMSTLHTLVLIVRLRVGYVGGGKRMWRLLERAGGGCV